LNNLEGKNVVIIGGTSGIGLAAALAASEQGANVWAAGRTEANLEKARKASKGAFKVAQVDTHDDAGLRSLFEEVGTIHHLVSAAIGGERTLTPFLEQTEEQFKAAFDKLWGYAKVVRAGSAYLADQACITLVSGSPARKIKPGQSALSCVGAAVENLARCLAVEMAPVRVNIVSPGTIATGMFDWMGDEKAAKLKAMTAGHLIRRAGESGEVAQGLLFVMQNAFVTGTTVDIDGGRLLG
jgi:NAD(P)-dependent dehydrogenase (short-subunit alcohol dehydrogenase family)